MKKLLLLFLICFMGVLNARTIPTETIVIETSFSTESKTELLQKRKKTVSVKSYKRKSGKTVKAHKRRPPRKH